MFDIGGYRLERLRVAGETARLRDEGPRYGWVRAGSGQLQYGDDRLDLFRGAFVRTPAGVDHRYASEEGLELLSVARSDGPVARVGASGAGARPADRQTVVGPDALSPGVESPDIVRETPFPDAEDDVLVLRARAEGGTKVGWHHHGANVYFGYFVGPPGSVSAVEHGADGRDVTSARPGECFHVPAGLVHRDTNPGAAAHTAVIWLCGGEPWVVNVDGPA